MDQVGVSVCLFSYNYEKYIAQALESILNQETDFPVEIVVGDDLSTDNTRSIVKEYHSRFPGRIVLSFNAENIGGTRNWIKTIAACKGKYIALLDGDDYFTDKRKLQKQYNLHENNPSFVLSFHSVEEVYEGMPEKNTVVAFEKEVYTLQDFLEKGWFIRTSSTFFRNGLVPSDPPAWVYRFPYRYDTILHVFLCLHGDAFNIRESMSVWRKHISGMSMTFRKDIIKDTREIIALEKELDRITGGRYKQSVRKYISRYYAILALEILRSPKWWKNIPLFLQSVINMDYSFLGSKLKRKLNATEISGMG